jgi:putative zinc finger/helix-turn-helix YgiT family protein
MNCIYCNGQLKLVEDALVRQEIRGEMVEVRSPAYECPKCKKHELMDGQGGVLRRRTADAYRRRHGLLTSTQIKECRLMLGLTQEQFAVCLGVGAVSVRRWETWLAQEPDEDRRIRKVTRIKTARQYEAALVKIEKLMDDAKREIDQGDELELLVGLVHEYEEKVYPIKRPGHTGSSHGRNRKIKI